MPAGPPPDNRAERRAPWPRLRPQEFSLTALPPTRVRARRIRRLSWLLWGLTFLLLIAFTVAVPMLYLPALDAVHGDSSQGTGSGTNIYYALVGLSGLVLLFCLYTTLKQRELEKMRETLAGEEHETENVRSRLSELSAMFQVSTTLNLQLKLEVILEIIVRRVVSAMRAQQASIMLYNPETGDLETRSSYGLEAEFARHAKKRMGEGIAGWVAERGEALLLNGSAREHSMSKHFKSDRNITSALSMPLRVGDRCVGVLNVNRINHAERFQDHHREILHMFAEHVAAVIERAEVLDRLGSRSRELEEANQRLTQINQMKDTFLSTASHELKTPLTTVIAYAELLDEDPKRLSAAQRTEFLHRLRAEADRLMALIEDILDLTRLESGKMVLRPVMVSPNVVAREAIETVRSLAEKRGMILREEYQADLPDVRLDEVKMRQVVVNLLANAIKFGPEKSLIDLQTAREPKYVRFEVRDRGPGIRPEDATHIFELFGQSHDGTASEHGVGIGLHLVKRITELHGGLVGVNSTPGEGSAFWVRLPVPSGRTEPQSSETAAA